MHFTYKNGNELEVTAGYVSGKLAEDIRSGRVMRMEILLGGITD